MPRGGPPHTHGPSPGNANLAASPLESQSSGLRKVPVQPTPFDRAVVVQWSKALAVKPASLRPDRRRPYQKSGLYTLKRAVLVLGSRALPAGNTALGRELRAWRSSLIADLGGPEAVSTQQLVIVEKAVTQKLICDSLDGYVLGLGSLVNKRHRTLWPVIRERAAQVALLQSLLRDLGLERRGQQEKDLALLLAEMHRQPAPAPQEHTPRSPKEETFQGSGNSGNSP